MSTLQVTVYARGALIGLADLSPVDPATGTYGGPFRPVKGYGAVRPAVLELMRRAWPRGEAANPERLRSAYRRHEALELQIRTQGGEELHPATVHIEDAGGVWTDAVPRVELVGLPEAEARRHFRFAGG